MANRKYTWNDQRVPRQATGQTPVRNIRIDDPTWLPALAKAEAEERSLTSVIKEALGRYNAQPLTGPRELNFTNWPDAKTWAQERATAIGNLTGDLAGACAVLPVEWLAVAAWLATTHHPADEKQQKHVITGHILSRLTNGQDDSWPDRYRDTRHLSETVQAILKRHLPLTKG